MVTASVSCALVIGFSLLFLGLDKVSVSNGPTRSDFIRPLDQRREMPMTAIGPGHTIFVDGPDGPPLKVVSETDARLEAAQLTPETQVYYGAASDGLLSLEPGAVVVDVGGNVGSFARLAARVVGSAGKVYSVEPIPEVYRVLEENCRTFHDFHTGRASDSSPVPQERQPAVIVPVHAGIVPNSGSGFEEFVFFPRCAALSTQAQHRNDADALQCTCSIVMNGQGTSTTWLQAVARGLARAVPWVYVPIHCVVSKGVLLGGARHVRCPVMTLSDLIDKYDIERIDLLKINVERGELGVLQSVRPQHWPRIRQVSMQLHDRQGALDQASQLLRAVGLKQIKVIQEPRFQSCCLVQVYARR